MHGVSITNNDKVRTDESPLDNKDDDDDFINDPMEVAFNNMQHHIEQMLFNSACIPYIACNIHRKQRQTYNIEKLKLL